jgi:hypothetical protein
VYPRKVRLARLRDGGKDMGRGVKGVEKGGVREAGDGMGQIHVCAGLQVVRDGVLK